MKRWEYLQSGDFRYKDRILWKNNCLCLYQKSIKKRSKKQKLEPDHLERCPQFITKPSYHSFRRVLQSNHFQLNPVISFWSIVFYILTIFNSFQPSLIAFLTSSPPPIRSVTMSLDLNKVQEFVKYVGPVLPCYLEWRTTAVFLLINQPFTYLFSFTLSLLSLLTSHQITIMILNTKKIHK